VRKLDKLHCGYLWKVVTRGGRSARKSERKSPNLRQVVD